MSGFWAAAQSIWEEVSVQARLMLYRFSDADPTAPPGATLDSGGAGGADSGGAGGADSGGAGDGGSGDSGIDWSDEDGEIWADWDTAYPYVETEDQTCYAQKKGEEPVCYAKGGKIQEHTLIVQGLKCDAGPEAPAPVGALFGALSIALVAALIVRRSS